MLSFFRQHKNKLLLVLIVLLVLAAAYIFTEKPPTAPSPVKEPAFSAASAESTASTETAFPESSLKPSTTSKPQPNIPSSDEASTGQTSLPPAESSVVRPESTVSVTESSAVFISEPSVEPSVITSDVSSMIEESSVVSVEEVPVSLPEESSAVSVIPSEPEVSKTSTPEPSAEPSEEPSVPQHTCTFSISCAVLTDRIEDLPKNKRSLVPSDGILSAPCTMTIEDGDSVFDITKRFCQAQRIPFEFTMTPVYHTAYIEGIANLYEFDCGSASGWVYTVNGEQPGVGCSDYAVHDGDTVIWHYTCALGNDITGT